MKYIQSRAERVLMVVIILFLTVPLPFTLLSQWKPLKKSLRMGHLNGVQLEQTYTPFSWSALFHSKYQESVSRFFDNEFFGRAHLINIANELYFRLFKVSPMSSTFVFVGKKDTLYEYIYLSEYCLDRRRKSELEPLVRDIRKLQDACARRGMGFTVLITPSKASIYPELIPGDWARRQDPRPRAYEEFLPLLKEQGIHVVDGHAIMVAGMDKAPAPIFPKGGIHWGAYGAWLTANALIAELQSQGKALQPVEYSGMRVSNNPKGEDADLLQLMNLLIPWHYPVADFTVKQAAPRNPRPGMVMVGGSFMWKLCGLLSESRQFSEIDCFYYYKLLKKTFVDGKSRVTAEPVQSINFDREIFAADNLVLEINESVIPSAPNHLINFTADALEHLPAEGSPKEPFLYENPQPAP